MEAVELASPPGPTPTPSQIPPVPSATWAPALREFTEQFEAGAPYWTFAQAGDASQLADARVEAGYLVFDLPAPNQWAYAIYEGQSYDDVRLDALVESGADATAASGLICRYNPGLGWYEFNIYPDGTYALLFGQWLTDGVARYIPLALDESEAITPGLNEIGLVCEGDVLTPYINGIQIRKRQEKIHVLAEGRVGIAAASFEMAPLRISYDWVRVGTP